MKYCILYGYFCHHFQGTMDFLLSTTEVRAAICMYIAPSLGACSCGPPVAVTCCFPPPIKAIASLSHLIQVHDRGTCCTLKCCGASGTFLEFGGLRRPLQAAALHRQELLRASAGVCRLRQEDQRRCRLSHIRCQPASRRYFTCLCSIPPTWVLVEAPLFDPSALFITTLGHVLCLLARTRLPLGTACCGG